MTSRSGGGRPDVAPGVAWAVGAWLALVPTMDAADGELFAEAPRVIHTLVGEAAGDQFGWVARNMGDLDGDGVADFAATSPTSNAAGAGAGRVYVYSSRAGTLLWRFDGRTGEAAGTSVGRAGDVDQDGVPDVIVGAPGSTGMAGRAYVLAGRGGRVIRELSAGESGDRFGQKSGGVGDFDGDGRPDLLVGAMGGDTAGTNAGSAYVLSGADGEILLNLEGEHPGDSFGSAAAGAQVGDVHLLAIGAMAGGPRRGGRIYLFRHSAGDVELVFTIDADETGTNLGQFFVALPGDFDGDGLPDVVASDFANAATGPGTGRVYVHSSSDGERLLTLTGERPGENFGSSDSSAGDVDHDGVPDLIVGAWQNAEHAASAGRCALHSGRDGRLLAEYTCRQAGDTFGFDATGLGDVDGDGALDFLLTSAWSAAPGPRTGRVFVVAGPRFAAAADAPSAPGKVDR